MCIFTAPTQLYTTWDSFLFLNIPLYCNHIIDQHGLGFAFYLAAYLEAGGECYRQHRRPKVPPRGIVCIHCSISNVYLFSMFSLFHILYSLIKWILSAVLYLSMHMPSFIANYVSLWYRFLWHLYCHVRILSKVLLIIEGLCVTESIIITQNLWIVIFWHVSPPGSIYGMVEIFCLCTPTFIFVGPSPLETYNGTKRMLLNIFKLNAAHSAP